MKTVKYNDNVRTLMVETINSIEEAWNYIKWSAVYDAPVVERKIKDAENKIKNLMNALEDVCVAHTCEFETIDSLPSVRIQVCKHCGKREERKSWA
jgi:hypothetical protein